MAALMLRGLSRMAAWACSRARSSRGPAPAPTRTSSSRVPRRTAHPWPRPWPRMLPAEESDAFPRAAYRAVRSCALGVRVGEKLRVWGSGSKSATKRTRYFCSSLPRSAVQTGTANVSKRHRNRLRITGLSSMAPVSLFPQARQRGRLWSNVYPPDKSTPGVIRGRKTRGLAWSIAPG